MRSLAAREEYTKAFRNLTVEETKIIEVFRASGEIDKRREIVSDLLVYHSQSSRDGKAVATEYRDVRLVNGKAEDNRGERASSLAQRTPQPSRRLT